MAWPILEIELLLFEHVKHSASYIFISFIRHQLRLHQIRDLLLHGSKDRSDRLGNVYNIIVE